MRRWLFRISIRRILLLVSLLFLLLPLGGIFFLRIYESALIRQTESELISQAAFVAALYKHEITRSLERAGIAPSSYGIPLQLKPDASKPFDPIQPSLDLAHERIYPPRPKPLYTLDSLDAAAQEAGANILPVLQDSQRITLSGIKVLDYQGIVTAGKEERGLSFAQSEEFQKARTGEEISLLRHRRMPKTQAPLGSASRNSNINVFVALPIILDDRLIGVVWVNRTPTDLWEALYGKRIELMWAGALLLLLSLLVSALTSYTITRPIRKLVQKTRLISEGNPEGMTPLANPITSEMAELSESVSNMAQTIQARTEYIRNFATHVSHEFKTPLTAIQGSIELLQDHLEKMPIEQQQRFLSNIAEDTERLKRLVVSLLELARADMTEPGRVQTAILPVLEALKERYKDKALDIIVRHDTNLPPIRVPADCLEAVLSNLLENSRQAGATQVEIEIGTSTKCVTLSFQDNGPGISEANQKEIFTPFFTTRRASGGTGLGLSIVHSLLARQGGRIQLASGTQGTCFQLELPIA